MTRIFSGLTAIAVSASLAGCMGNATPGEMSIADRIIAAVVEGCKIIPAVQAVTNIVTEVVPIGADTAQIIDLADRTATAICAEFRTNPINPEVAGVALTGTVVQ